MKKINFNLILKNITLIDLIECNKENLIQFLKWENEGLEDFDNTTNKKLLFILSRFSHNISDLIIENNEEFMLFFYKHRNGLFNYYNLHKSVFFSNLLKKDLSIPLVVTTLKLITSLDDFMDTEFNAIESFLITCYVNKNSTRRRMSESIIHNYKRSSKYIDFLKFLQLKKSALLENENFLKNEIQEISPDLLFLEGSSDIIDSLFFKNFQIIKDDLIQNKYTPNTFNREYILLTNDQNTFNREYILLTNDQKDEINKILIDKKKTHLLNIDSIKIFNKKVLYELLSKCCYSILISKYGFNQKNIEDMFIYLKKNNCMLISHMPEKYITTNYSELKTYILNGAKIGKQGLKYFLIKNKQRLTMDIINYALKRYPTFKNSLKIKDTTNLLILDNKKPFEYNLNELLIKPDDLLTDEDKLIIESHKKNITEEKKINENYSEFVMNIIKNELFFNNIEPSI